MMIHDLLVAPEIEYTPIITSFDGIDELKPRGTKIEYTKEMSIGFKNLWKSLEI